MTKYQASKILLNNIQYICEKSLCLKEIKNSLSEIKEAVDVLVITRASILPRRGGEIIIQNNSFRRLASVLADYDNERFHKSASTLLRYRSKYSLDENYFSTPTIENSYWAGLIAADGCIYRSKGRKDRLQLTLHKIDRYQLENLKEALRTNIPIQDSSTSACSILRISSNKLCLDLEKHWNITPKKSLTIQPPNILKYSLIKAFITGLIDGDGCIRYNTLDNKWGVYILAGTNDLAMWIRDFLAIGNVNPSRMGKIFQLGYTANSAKKVVGLLGTVKVPRLARKWEKILSELS